MNLFKLGVLLAFTSTIFYPMEKEAPAHSSLPVKASELMGTSIRVFPYDVDRYIIKNFFEPTNNKRYESLAKVAKCIRAYIQIKPLLFTNQFYNYLIQELAKRYKKCHIVNLACAINTRGVAKWLRKRCKLDDQFNKNAFEFYMNLLRYEFGNFNCIANKQVNKITNLKLLLFLTKAMPEWANKKYKGWAPLHGVAFSYTKEADEIFLAKKLVANGADLNAYSWNKPGFFTTPLLIALRGNKNALAQTLIELGADVNLKSYDGRNALFYAIANRSSKIMGMLVAKNIDVNQVLWNQQTPLMVAVSFLYDELVQQLLEAGADVHYKSDRALKIARNKKKYLPYISKEQRMSCLKIIDLLKESAAEPKGCLIS